METIKLIFAGDYSPVNRTSQLSQERSFNLIFNDLLPILRDKDFSVVSFESTISDSTIALGKIGPNIKNSPHDLDSLLFAKFDLVTLANNHIMDYGEEGLLSTIESCKNVALDYLGVGKNINEARRIYYKQIKNKKIAIINFAENEFSTTEDLSPGANPVNPITNFYDIQQAKLNSDFVFVMVHGGNENYIYPSPKLKSLFRFYVDAGASAVICSHAHCYSGHETYNEGHIFYGLGNFVFDWFMTNKEKFFEPWNYGYLVSFEIEDKIQFKLIPYIQSSKKPGVYLLNKEERNHFFKQIEQINGIIKNDSLLKTQFTDFCNKSRKSYLLYLVPYFKLLFRAYFYLFPNSKFFSRKQCRLLLNIIRCESHREILINILKKSI